MRDESGTIPIAWAALLPDTNPMLQLLAHD
jgi:hypothetical protein